MTTTSLRKEIEKNGMKVDRIVAFDRFTVDFVSGGIYYWANIKNLSVDIKTIKKEGSGAISFL
jgi:hypothetical protein